MSFSAPERYVLLGVPSERVVKVFFFEIGP